MSTWRRRRSKVELTTESQRAQRKTRRNCAICLSLLCLSLCPWRLGGSTPRRRVVALDDQADRQEKQRRVDAAIARASACHMSDTKWRKLFGLLRELGVGPLRWKFVRDDRVFVQPAPPAFAVLERTFGDVLPYPYGPYREIEWV